MAAVGRHHRRSAAAEGRATFVLAMNRVDVVDLVVDLVDVDLDVDLVDVDLVDVVSLSSGFIFIFWPLGPRLYFCLLAAGCIFAFWPPAVPAVFSPGCFWGFLVHVLKFSKLGRAVGWTDSRLDRWPLGHPSGRTTE